MADSLRCAQPSLVRRQHTLNPIIEEDSDDGQTRNASSGHHRLRRTDTSNLKIQAWLSPMSDHFPTPRGINYLSAPILPSSPSASSASESSPTTSSNQWNRNSVATANTEFEDLYDVTDDEDCGRSGVQRKPSARSSMARNASSKQLMRLTIPETRAAAEEQRSALDEFKKITSPVPLTPSAQLTMSPAQLFFMDKQHAHDVPTISAPPSLDGSLTSEQLAAMSAPPTPVVGNDEEPPAEESWSGVQLQPGALATLHALSGDDEDTTAHEQPDQLLEISQPVAQRPTEMAQQPARIVTSFQPHTASGLAQSARQSLADLTKLDIPSPGGFFAELSPRTRSTWHMSMSPESMAPPTSATAEKFYRCPWNIDSAVPPVPAIPEPSSAAEDFYRSIDRSLPPVEQVVEVSIDDDMSDDMPTARPILEHKNSGSSGETIQAPASPTSEDAPTEIVADVDVDYARKRQSEALSNLDRTELWLLAQRAYLKAFDEKEEDGSLETIDEDAEEESPKKTASALKEASKAEDMQVMAPLKKSVRFCEMNSVVAQPKRLPSKLLRQESAYYRAFQDYIVRTHQADAFIHQLVRFEALQAQRVALRDSHRNQLLGKYQLSVVPQSAKKRLSTNVVRGDDALTDDLEKIRLEKEHEAADQMAMPTWNVAAIKFLNGGKLITAPVSKRLARMSHVKAGRNGSRPDRARVLDIGGQSTCDWAWHCALQYPNTKVYSVVTKTVRQLSNSNIRGPPNHRQVAVERLTRLPFEDNHFDLVNARELHSHLKLVGGNGEDEWESCLKECMRVLKPGGYIEFSLLDSELINAGPLGLAKSVEFGFSLKTLGYDPNPSKLWLGRLARAGFEDVRRMWTCLPVGTKQSAQKLPTPPPTTDNGSIPATASLPLMGSTEDVASVCSLVGGWNWERWLLRCEMEKVAGEMRLADTVTTGAAMEEAGKCLQGVAAMMEEGRACKSAFRMLNGYARKPLANDSEIINIALAH